MLENGADTTITDDTGRTTLWEALDWEFRPGVELLLPFVEVEEWLRGSTSKKSCLLQDCVKQELARLQAVKESFDDLFHEQLLEEVCEFLVSEKKMKAWLRPSRKRKRED